MSWGRAVQNIEAERDRARRERCLQQAQGTLPCYLAAPHLHAKVIRADIASPFQLRHMLFTADAVAGGGCIPLRWVPDAPLHVSALPPAEIVSMYECQICFPVQTPVLSMPDKLGIHECCASQVYGG